METAMDWRTRLIEDMKLHDLKERTQEAYTLATRQLVDHFARPPEELTEDEVRGYFLHLREVKKIAPSTLNVAVCGIRFFFVHTLDRDWGLFDILRVKRPRTLPVVLSTSEVRTILAAVRNPVRRMSLTAIYALGLRITEGLALQTRHIDHDRQLVWVRKGKGDKDRAVPLPEPLYLRLRRYWKQDRPNVDSDYLFVPNHGPGPFDESTLQKTFTAVREELRLAKHATVHTLRHSYATHMLEAGVTLPTIQRILGHKSLRTTLLYMHVTQPATERVQEVVDRLMADL